jgi:Family of unknown function (DUF6281)
MIRFASIACIGLVVALLGSACGDSGLGAGGAGSCAAILHWQGRTYMGLSTAISPRRTGRLGSGQFPACNDTGRTTGHAQQVSVYRLQGVPPRQAVLTDTFVFVADYTRLPRKVQALVHAPRCSKRTRGAVVATWGGVDTTHKAQFDGDIGKPPYRLALFVQRGPRALLRANINAKVTDATAGPPLTPIDVKQVLWTGGTLALDLACSPDGSYRVVRIGQRTPG